MTDIPVMGICMPKPKTWGNGIATDKCVSTLELSSYCEEPDLHGRAWLLRHGMPLGSQLNPEGP